MSAIEISFHCTSVLGMYASDSSELALYFPTRRVPCPLLDLDWQIQTGGLNSYRISIALAIHSVDPIRSLDLSVQLIALYHTR